MTDHHEDRELNPYQASDSQSPRVKPSDSTYRGPMTLRGIVRIGQLLRGALMSGITVVVVILVIISEQLKFDPTVNMLVIVGGLAFMSASTASLLAPRLIPVTGSVPRSKELAQTLADVDEHERLPRELHPLMETFTRTNLISAAILEGTALVNAMLWFVDGKSINLALAVLLIVMMGLQFPTLERLRNFLVRETSPKSANDDSTGN